MLEAIKELMSVLVRPWSCDSVGPLCFSVMQPAVFRGKCHTDDSLTSTAETMGQKIQCRLYMVIASEMAGPSKTYIHIPIPHVTLYARLRVHGGGGVS